MPKFKTMRNWERKHNIKLEWDVQTGGNVTNVRCSSCKQQDRRLQGLKNYNRGWVKGSKNATCDSVRKHVNTDMHKNTVDLASKIKPGAILKMPCRRHLWVSRS